MKKTNQSKAVRGYALVYKKDGRLRIEDSLYSDQFQIFSRKPGAVHRNQGQGYEIREVEIKII